VLLQGKLFVPAILGSLSSLEDIDEVPAGFAWVFFAADTGAILLRSCISSELANTDSISLLFREETAYVRAISSFIHVRVKCSLAVLFRAARNSCLRSHHYRRCAGCS